jgi:hypothetical protein
MPLRYSDLNLVTIEKAMKEENYCVIKLSKRKAEICEKMIRYYERMAGIKGSIESPIKVAFKALILQLWTTVFYRKLASIVVAYSAFRASFTIYNCNGKYKCIELRAKSDDL